MTYKKRPEITTGDPAEMVVELPSGDLVAVSCEISRCKTSQCPILLGHARWVDDEGRPRTDFHDAPVETRYVHKASHADVERHGIEALVRAVSYLVLGEPIETHNVDGEIVPVLHLPADTLATAAIAQGIATARRTFAPVAMSTIL